MGYCRKCPDAVAEIRGGVEAPQVAGCVRFYQRDGYVLVAARVYGLPLENKTGFFGFHIHQGGSCWGLDFGGTGGHYDPADQRHPEHAGDLPLLLACRGNACLSVKTDRFAVKDILGRTVVIHGEPDDFHSQPAGHAGKKIACGMICKGR